MFESEREVVNSAAGMPGVIAILRSLRRFARGAAIFVEGNDAVAAHSHA
jgi:hypothetical protein